MKIELLQNLSIFWAMLHVLVLFILLFRPRFTKKKTMLIAGGGISVLMILNIAILIYWGFDVISKVFFFTCSVPSFIFFYLLSQDKKFRFLLTFCLADTTCLWVMAVTNLMDYFFGGRQVYIDVYQQNCLVSIVGIFDLSLFAKTLFRTSECGQNRMGRFRRNDNALLCPSRSGSTVSYEYSQSARGHVSLYLSADSDVI